MNPAVVKYLQVVGIVVLCIVLDQWSKHAASTRLATHFPGDFTHYIQLTVPPELDGKTVRDVVEHEFGGWNSPDEIEDILFGVTNDGAVLLPASREVSAGDVIEVRKREVVVVPDYFDFQYARNEGAAFSMLADADPEFRKPFFLGVGVIALLLIFGILRGVELRQQLLIVALALIGGGAVGNLVDRVLHGYVIDFIVWKWTDEYRWPTFNLADTFIVVGVALMCIELIRDTIRERREKAVSG